MKISLKIFSFLAAFSTLIQSSTAHALQVGDRVIFAGKVGRVTKYTFVAGESASVLAKAPVEIEGVPTTLENVIELIPNNDPETRKVSDIPAVLKDFVVPLEKFNAFYTTDGTLFHGTDSVQKMISMTENGFGSKKYFGKWGFLGGQKYSMPPDTGLYLATSISLSEGYAGKEGGVLELRLKDSKKIRILDLRSVTPQVLQGLMDEAARSHDQDLNLYLARKYGIDIIAIPSLYSMPGTKPVEMVLLNQGVLDFPSSVKDLPSWQWRNFEKRPSLSRLELFYRLSQTVNPEGLSSLEKMAAEAIERHKPNWKTLSEQEKINWLGLVGRSLNQDHLVYVRGGLNDSTTRLAAVEALVRSKDSKTRDTLLREVVEKSLRALASPGASIDPVIVSLFSELSDHLYSNMNRLELERIRSWLCTAPQDVQKAILSQIFYKNPKSDTWFEFGLSSDRPESVWREALFHLGRNATRKERLKKWVESLTVSAAKLKTDAQRLGSSPQPCPH